MTSRKSEREKQLWDLWSLSDGEIGEKLPEEVLKEWS